MRKRIALTILGLAVAAIAAYLVFRPKVGTVDYHKTGYLKARNRLEGNTLRGRCGRLIERITGVKIRMTAKTNKTLSLKLEEHEKALLECGYLVEHQFVITNNLDKVWLSTVGNRKRFIPEEYARYTRVAGVGTPILYVVGRPSDLPKWEEVIRTLDVPESAEK